jgi:hypothetical protein
MITILKFENIIAWQKGMQLDNINFRSFDYCSRF